MLLRTQFNCKTCLYYIYTQWGYNDRYVNIGLGKGPTQNYTKGMVPKFQYAISNAFWMLSPLEHISTQMVLRYFKWVKDNKRVVQMMFKRADIRPLFLKHGGKPATLPTSLCKRCSLYNSRVLSIDFLIRHLNSCLLSVIMFSIKLCPTSSSGIFWAPPKCSSAVAATGCGIWCCPVATPTC